MFTRRALFCALLRTYVCAFLLSDLRLRFFALICALLRSFACFWELQKIAAISGRNQGKIAIAELRDS